MADWQDPETIVLWLGTALVLLLVLGGTMVLFIRLYFRRILKSQRELADIKLQHQERLLANSVEVQERERQRVAADLHDDLLGKLHTLRLRLHRDSEDQDSQQLLVQTIATARRLSHDLSPPLLEETSLNQLLEEQVTLIRPHYKIVLWLNDVHAPALPSLIKLQVLRIYQELINNIIKHAQATEVSIYLRVSERNVTLVVEDDGKGFDGTSESQGLGMKNIELRAQLLAGHYRFRRRRPSGTTFTLSIPTSSHKSKELQHDSSRTG